MSLTKKKLEEFHRYMSIRRHYSNLFVLVRNLKNKNDKGIINYYHKNPTKISNKVAYLTGLIDGEGYFKCEKNNNKCFRLIIGMCDKKTIYWIKKNFGGNITVQKTQLGKPFYVWRLNQGKELFYLLLLLIPYLVNKRKIALKFFKNILKKLSKLDHVLYPSNLLGKD
jgi:hypothetical protein